MAELAGVSSRTVSNVVNGYANVTERTRVRVQRAVEELGYRPNVLARNLAQGRSGQIALVVPYLDTPYFSELLQSVIRAARISGYNVLIDQTDGDPEHERAFIAHGSRRLLFDGVIFSPLGLDQQALADRDPKLPLVILGERTSDALFRSTVTDLLSKGQHRLVINLEQVAQLDTSGLTALVNAHLTASKRGGALKLVNPTTRVRELLHITRLDTLFQIFDSENQALASFSE